MSKVYEHNYSWTEFLELVTKGKRPSCRNPSSLRIDSGTWAGTSSMQEALDHLTKGWSGGIDQLRKLQEDIPADLFDGIMPPKEFKPEMTHTIAGGTLDVAAHLSGATPEVFIAEQVLADSDATIVKGRKLQTIYVNIGNTAGYSVEAFMHRGCYIYSLVEHMENCGYSTEVWAISSNIGAGACEQFIRVKVKEFGELLDPNKLVCSLCSAFMFRRFIFAIMEMQSAEEVRHLGADGSSYGRTFSPTIEQACINKEDQLDSLLVNVVNTEDPQQIGDAVKKILSDHLINKSFAQFRD